MPKSPHGWICFPFLQALEMAPSPGELRRLILECPGLFLDSPLRSTLPPPPHPQSWEETGASRKTQEPARGQGFRLQKGCGGVGVRGRYSGPPPLGASPTGWRRGAGKEEGRARGAARRDTEQTGRRPKAAKPGRGPPGAAGPSRSRPRERGAAGEIEAAAAGREGRARSRGTQTCGEGRVRGPWKE